MPDFPEVPQQRAAKALEKLGFTVDRSKGKGGHFKVFGPSGRFTILPSHLKASGTRHSIVGGASRGKPKPLFMYGQKYCYFAMIYMQ